MRAGELERMFFCWGRIAALIYEGLKKSFEQDPRLIMIGEDICAPYGGAFKVSRDLSELYSDRLFNMPISEASLIGVGVGLALGGRIPIVEIMFGDFLGLGFDQLLNHACKLAFMYNDQVNVPLVVRTPMGGRRGYGPTHSQSIEKHFLGMPGLEILALNQRYSPEELYGRLLSSVSKPTLVIENKVLYTRALAAENPFGFQATFSDEAFPTLKISARDRVPDVTLFGYGGMLEEIEKAAAILFEEEEVICEIICPARIQPFNVQPLAESVARTDCLALIEEGSGFAGLSSEAIAQLVEKRLTPKRICRISWDDYIPSSFELERQSLPCAQTIVDSVKSMLDS